MTTYGQSPVYDWYAADIQPGTRTRFDAWRSRERLGLRGAQSDLLSRETAAEMAARGPRPRVAEIPDVGHAPTFMPASQIEPVREFLLEGLG